MKYNLKIGNVKIENPLVLAPMHGINCAAFRVLCRKYGAGLIYSQMIDADGLLNAKEKYIDFVKEEKPLTAQLVGSDEIKMAKAAEILSEYADIIDVNFGCCESSALGKKAGAYLIKHPQKIPKIISKIVDAVDNPVTAKIRIGWDEKSINAVEVAKMIEEAGASGIAVHGRTKAQGFTGTADWDVIKKVKDAVKIPVIGNGDVNTAERAKLMMDKTKCDFVMIGRAAKGNPFIFKESLEFLEKGHYKRHSVAELKKAFSEFLELYKNKDVEKRYKVSEIRDHAMWFLHGLKNAAILRNDLMKCDTEEQIIKIWDEVK